MLCSTEPVSGGWVLFVCYVELVYKKTEHVLKKQYNQHKDSISKK